MTPAAAWLSKVAQQQTHGPFKRLLPYLRNPQTVSLASGMPAPSVFPFKAMSLELVSDGDDKVTVDIQPSELSAALQYGATSGFPPLLSWVQQHVAKAHAPPNQASQAALSVGSTDALYKAGMAVLDPDDVVLTEEYSWVTLFAVARDRGAVCESVLNDDDGMIPEKLEEACQRLVAQGKRPKMVYLVPIGHNPTGTSLSLARKKQIYTIAQKFDMVIVEDDAYFYLQLPSLDTAGDADPSCMPGLHRLPPTMLSLDVDGRVIRFDTFAKAFGPGLRLGIITAHKDILDPILLFNETNVSMPNGLACVAMYKLVEKWGDDGFHRHLCKVQAEFHRRRRVLLDLMDKHLTGLLHWKAPEAGMFVWIDFPNTTDAEPVVEELINVHHVLVIAGHYFSKTRMPTSRARLTFALATDAQMETGVVYV